MACGSLLSLGATAPLRYCTCGAALWLLAGCADESARGLAIHGDVKFQGRPVEDGVISLLPTSGGPPVSALVKNGSYAIPPELGPPPGTFRVEIEGFRKTGRKIHDFVTAPAPGQTPNEIDQRTPFVPAKFNSQSTLTIDVANDNERHDFDLRL